MGRALLVIQRTACPMIVRAARCITNNDKQSKAVTSSECQGSRHQSVEFSTSDSYGHDATHPWATAIVVTAICNSEPVLGMGEVGSSLTEIETQINQA